MPRTPKAAPKANVSSKASSSSKAVTAKATAGKRRRTYLPASERRRRIISAAQKVFSQTSLQGARTRQLAKAAEINQATLFEHFESKEDLFVAAVVQPLLEAMQGMRERADAYNRAASAKDFGTLARASVQRHFESMLKIYPLLATALFADPTLGKKLYCEQIVPLLRERGEVMRGLTRDSVDPHLLALAAFGIFFAVAMDGSFQSKSQDPATLAGQVFDLVAFGFAREREP
jgi:AcrR family transcriptional regulator